MPTAWNGGDPVEVVDSEDYELGVAYRAEADLTMTHARIYTPAGEETIAPRRFRVWSNVGGLQYTETLPDDLPSGWYLHELTTPQEITSGTVFIPSFNTGGNYGALANALDSDVVSADGNVTALAAINAPGGNNGRFNETPGAFPNLGAGSHPFYGVDFQYVLGIGGNTAPSVTAVEISSAGATITAAATVADAETLVGATLRFDWGDGTADTLTSWPDVDAQHTYAASGLYAVLVTVTDSAGLSGNRAVVARVGVPTGGNELSEAAVQAAVFLVLSTDPALAALVNGVGDGPPESAGGDFAVADLPYVDLGDVISMQDNDHGAFGREIVHTIHVWTRAYSTGPGYTISRRVAALLDHQWRALNAVIDAPHRVVSIRLEYEQALRDPKPDIRHLVMRFRIHTSVDA